jgi:glutamate/tyrosine decarboxylase-like PLP-dependent enzyme
MPEDLRTAILRLREAASPLEPDAAARRELGKQALDHALAYLDQVETASTNRPWSEVFSQHLEPEFAEQGRNPARVLDYVAECVDRPGFATTSPRFMAYIPGGGLFHSALGDLLAAASNKYSGFASASPGAVRIENACTQWLASVIGYPETAAGTLTSGGSIANLTAVVAAREARDPDGGGAVYTTRFAHYCIDKALHIAGRGRSPRRQIETDASHRMSVAALEEALEADVRNGIRPWLVVASGGTVDTGAIDPLPEIAELCRNYGAWFHVDGAYGGLFALCDEGRELLQGIDQADSVALDPHKTLFLPYGTGAADRGLQRHRPLHQPSRRVRSRAVARRSVTRADAPFPRNEALASAADRRRRRLPRRPIGEARARPIFPPAAIGDRRLRSRSRAGPVRRRLPLCA